MFEYAGLDRNARERHPSNMVTNVTRPCLEIYMFHVATFLRWMGIASEYYFRTSLSIDEVKVQ